MRTLIESTEALHRDHDREEPRITVVEGGYWAVLREARELISRATRTIDIMHARITGGQDEPARDEGVERQLIYGASDTVTVRLLSSPALVDEDFVREQLGKDRPVAIRIARVPPLQALMADGTVALVVAESAAGRRASLIKAPDLLHTLATLFENIWRVAVPAGERVVFGDGDRGALARRILAALWAGVTDEVAARDLTVSVRTYRRHVAEIMALLGAGSRFQAGVRAAELGLLPPTTPHRSRPGDRP
ncbi:LuxR family transcriptional regulator [Streptomyces sp. 15-116A]|uniref:LuxR family transcriptional regulator n=1 Tax=Streptomyces sp. 15-116A TaxID=2259035 RepID=UPI0021B29905|nr:LuxR family transcriptional regulator [Streptomyces sp. 15-116A]MCT7356789.1 LuxR family transcriptional regulator [Streptomyces sp. 15-116A]